MCLLEIFVELAKMVLASAGRHDSGSAGGTPGASPRGTASSSGSRGSVSSSISFTTASVSHTPHSPLFGSARSSDVVMGASLGASTPLHADPGTATSTPPSTSRYSADAVPVGQRHRAHRHHHHHHHHHHDHSQHSHRSSRLSVASAPQPATLAPDTAGVVHPPLVPSGMPAPRQPPAGTRATLPAQSPPIAVMTDTASPAVPPPLGSAPTAATPPSALTSATGTATQLLPLAESSGLLSVPQPQRSRALGDGGGNGGGGMTLLGGGSTLGPSQATTLSVGSPSLIGHISIATPKHVCRVTEWGLPEGCRAGSLDEGAASRCDGGLWEEAKRLQGCTCHFLFSSTPRFSCPPARTHFAPQPSFVSSAADSSLSTAARPSSAAQQPAPAPSPLASPRGPAVPPPPTRPAPSPPASTPFTPLTSSVDQSAGTGVPASPGRSGSSAGPGAATTSVGGGGVGGSHLVSFLSSLSAATTPVPQQLLQQGLPGGDASSRMGAPSSTAVPEPGKAVRPAAAMAAALVDDADVLLSASADVAAGSLLGSGAAAPAPVCPAAPTAGADSLGEGMTAGTAAASSSLLSEAAATATSDAYAAALGLSSALPSAGAGAGTSEPGAALLPSSSPRVLGTPPTLTASARRVGVRSTGALSSSVTEAATRQRGPLGWSEPSGLPAAAVQAASGRVAAREQAPMEVPRPAGASLADDEGSLFVSADAATPVPAHLPAVDPARDSGVAASSAVSTVGGVPSEPLDGSARDGLRSPPVASPAPAPALPSGGPPLPAHSAATATPSAGSLSPSEPVALLSCASVSSTEAALAAALSHGRKGAGSPPPVAVRDVPVPAPPQTQPTPLPSSARQTGPASSQAAAPAPADVNVPTIDRPSVTADVGLPHLPPTNTAASATLASAAAHAPLPASATYAIATTATSPPQQQQQSKPSPPSRLSPPLPQPSAPAAMAPVISLRSPQITVPVAPPPQTAATPVSTDSAPIPSERVADTGQMRASAPRLSPRSGPMAVSFPAGSALPATDPMLLMPTAPSQPSQQPQPQQHPLLDLGSRRFDPTSSSPSSPVSPLGARAARNGAMAAAAPAAACAPGTEVATCGGPGPLAAAVLRSTRRARISSGEPASTASPLPPPPPPPPPLPPLLVPPQPAPATTVLHTAGSSGATLAGRPPPSQLSLSPMPPSSIAGASTPSLCMQAGPASAAAALLSEPPPASPGPSSLPSVTATQRMSVASPSHFVGAPPVSAPDSRRPQLHSSGVVDVAPAPFPQHRHGQQRFGVTSPAAVKFACMHDKRCTATRLTTGTDTLVTTANIAVVRQRALVSARAEPTSTLPRGPSAAGHSVAGAHAKPSAEMSIPRRTHHPAQQHPVRAPRSGATPSSTAPTRETSLRRRRPSSVTPVMDVPARAVSQAPSATSGARQPGVALAQRTRAHPRSAARLNGGASPGTTAAPRPPDVHHPLAFRRRPASAARSTRHLGLGVNYNAAAAKPRRQVMAGAMVRVHAPPSAAAPPAPPPPPPAPLAPPPPPPPPPPRPAPPTSPTERPVLPQPNSGQPDVGQVASPAPSLGLVEESAAGDRSAMGGAGGSAGGSSTRDAVAANASTDAKASGKAMLAESSMATLATSTTACTAGGVVLEEAWTSKAQRLRYVGEVDRCLSDPDLSAVAVTTATAAMPATTAVAAMTTQGNAAAGGSRPGPLGHSKAAEGPAPGAAAYPRGSTPSGGTNTGAGEECHRHPSRRRAHSTDVALAARGETPPAAGVQSQSDSKQRRHRHHHHHGRHHHHHHHHLPTSADTSAVTSSGPPLAPARRSTSPLRSSQASRLSSAHRRFALRTSVSAARHSASVVGLTTVVDMTPEPINPPPRRPFRGPALHLALPPVGVSLDGPTASLSPTTCTAAAARRVSTHPYVCATAPAPKQARWRPLSASCGVRPSSGEGGRGGQRGANRLLAASMDGEAWSRATHEHTTGRKPFGRWEKECGRWGEGGVAG